MHLRSVPTSGQAERREPRLPLRRAGERREPMPAVVLAADFLEACREKGLHPLVAAEIALEAAVARQELNSLGCGELWLDLVRATAGARPTGIAAPQRRYFRSLTMRRSKGRAQLEEHAAGVVVDVPVRLFPRVTGVVEDALGPESLDDAIALEVAAIASGRTLVEWVLAQALALKS